MSPHFLTNFEIRKYHQHESKFKVVHSRNSIPKIQDGTCVINHDEYKSIRTYWIGLYVKCHNVT